MTWNYVNALTAIDNSPSSFSFFQFEMSSVYLMILTNWIPRPTCPACFTHCNWLNISLWLIYGDCADLKEHFKLLQLNMILQCDSAFSRATFVFWRMSLFCFSPRWSISDHVKEQRRKLGCFWLTIVGLTFYQLKCEFCLWLSWEQDWSQYMVKRKILTNLNTANYCMALYLGACHWDLCTHRRLTTDTPEGMPWLIWVHRKLSNIQRNCWQFPVTANCSGLTWPSATSIPVCP